MSTSIFQVNPWKHYVDALSGNLGVDEYSAILLLITEHDIIFNYESFHIIINEIGYRLSEKEIDNLKKILKIFNEKSSIWNNCWDIDDAKFSKWSEEDQTSFYLRFK